MFNLLCVVRWNQAEHGAVAQTANEYFLSAEAFAAQREPPTRKWLSNSDKLFSRVVRRLCDTSRACASKPIICPGQIFHKNLSSASWLKRESESRARSTAAIQKPQNVPDSNICSDIWRIFSGEKK